MEKEGINFLYPQSVFQSFLVTVSKKLLCETQTHELMHLHTNLPVTSCATMGGPIKGTACTVDFELFLDLLLFAPPAGRTWPSSQNPDLTEYVCSS